MRSFVSVFLGMLTWAVIVQGAFAAVQAASPDTFAADGSTESAAVLVGFLALSVVASVAAGQVTARLAPRAPMKHVLVLGLIQLALGIFFQARAWEVQPLWYHLPFLVLLLPGNLVGGLMVGQGAAQARAA